MGVFSFLEKSNRSAVKLVFYLDVGRGSGRSAVIEMRNGIPHILYTVVGEQKVPQSTEKIDAVDRALSSLKETIEQTARALQKGSRKDKIYAAEEVYVILAAPYYLAHTNIISHKKEKPFVVSPKIVHDMLADAKQKLPPAHNEAIISEYPMTVHEKIIDMEINGYHTSVPYGRNTEELSLSVFRSQISTLLFDGIHRVVREYTVAPVYVETFSLASYVMLRNQTDGKESFVFVTIGNEVSEVSVVRQNVLLETVSFPFGKYSLARSIAKKLSCNPEEALSRVSLYYDKKLHSNDVIELMPILEASQAEWFSYLEKALVNMAQETAVPEDIFILADTELKDLFGGAVTNSSFAGQALVPNGFSIHILDNATFANSCTFGLNIRFDTLLAVSTVFAAAAREAVPALYPEKVV